MPFMILLEESPKVNGQFSGSDASVLQLNGDPLMPLWWIDLQIVRTKVKVPITDPYPSLLP